MPALDLRPDVDGYSVEPLPSVISIKTAGGFPRQRKDLLNETSIFTVQFTLGREKYEYFQKFYRSYVLNPQWFDILLASDPSLDIVINHKAQIVPGTYRLQSYSGLKYVIAMQLEAYADPL